MCVTCMWCIYSPFKCKCEAFAPLCSSLLGSCTCSCTTYCALCIVACWTRASHEGLPRKKIATEPSKSFKEGTATQQYTQQLQQSARLCALISCLIKQPAFAEIHGYACVVSFMVCGAQRDHQCLFWRCSMVKASHCAACLTVPVAQKPRCCWSKVDFSRAVGKLG